MRTHEQKFKIGDRVKTNDLYNRVFPDRDNYDGVVTSISPIECTDLSKTYMNVMPRPKKTVFMVKVGYHRAISQDYFERDE